MRREYIKFNNLPINVKLINIEEYPIHWHNVLEIMIILQGSIDISVESDMYRLKEGEIEIINMDEAHRISSDNDNLVLIVHIDLNFLQRYYNDIKNIFFYTDCSFEGEPQINEKYKLLKKYISMIVCELVQKGEDFDIYIKDTLVKLLYLLINDFHYLIYENENLRDNLEQLQRYHRIVKYIYNNYNENISLKNIAKREFLSAHYLSNEIKNRIGINFMDFVNLTRVDESIKLLLDTDMNIAEISYEVGFSHTRYYNKNFKKYYKMTPLQYRRKYKVDEDELEQIKKVKFYDLKDVLKYIKPYLEDYDRYNYKEKLVRIDIDASCNKGEFVHNYKDMVNLGTAHRLLEKDMREFLKQIQKDIGFNYGKISKFFSKDMGIYDKGIINFKKLKKVIDIILSEGLRPDFLFCKEDLDINRYKEVLYNFFEYFKEEYGNYEIGKWRYSVDSNLPENDWALLYKIIEGEYGLILKEEDVKDVKSPVYDTSYMVPYIIHQVSNKRVWEDVKIIDSFSSNTNLDNAVFFGDTGILNWEGLKKPSYYAYYILSKLGNTLVAKGDGYIVTSQDEDLQILLYSFDDNPDPVINLSNISLNITNLWHDYKVVRFEIHGDVNNCYKQWKAMGSPAMLNDDDIKFLKLSSFPRVNLGYKKKKTVQHLNAKIKGYGAVLILFKALR